MTTTPETTVPATPEPAPFERLGRWLDMLDEALEIGKHRKTRTEEH